MTKVTDLEANMEQFKIDQAAINSYAAEQRALLQETIEKNKLLKALQPSTTLPATILCFEENSGQCFSSDEVEKEELILMSMDKGDVTGPILAVKEDLGQKLIDDLDEPLMVLRCLTRMKVCGLMTDMRGGQSKEEFGIRELQEVNVEATP
ncbi:hypothetical protein Tco_1350565 [Tanacetum coccineum]